MDQTTLLGSGLALVVGSISAVGVTGCFQLQTRYLLSMMTPFHPCSLSCGPFLSDARHTKDDNLGQGIHPCAELFGFHH